MKKIIINCLIASLAIVTVQSCRPDKVLELKAPVSVTSNFAGTWKITNVMQSDVVATSKGFPYKSMDITNLFPYSDFTLILNMDGANPTTFTTVKGLSPAVIPLSGGNWFFNNTTYPDTLILAGLTDTLKIKLGSYPVGTTAQLPIVVNKYDASSGAKLISYNYLFTKQQ